MRIAKTIFLGGLLGGLFFLPTLLKLELPLCGFRGFTGKPCPLCGMTRALSLLVQGEWGPACRLHCLSPFVLLLLAGAFFNEILGGISPKTFPLGWSGPTLRWTGNGVAIGFGVYGMLRWFLPI